MTAPLRLLPWTTPEGKPCYLSTDSSASRLSRLADDLEAAQLDSGAQVLAGTSSWFRPPHGPASPGATAAEAGVTGPEVGPEGRTAGGVPPPWPVIVPGSSAAAKLCCNRRWQNS